MNMNSSEFGPPLGGNSAPQNARSPQTICDNNNRLNQAKIQAKRNCNSKNMTNSSQIEPKSGCSTRNVKASKLLPVAKPIKGTTSVLYPEVGEKGYTTRKKIRIKLNNLWAIWYGIFGALLQAYISITSARKYLSYTLLPWNNHNAIYTLHACIITTAVTMLLNPIFFLTTIFKTGNFPNDGKKMGRKKLFRRRTKSACRNLYRFGGPVSAVIHLITAFCFLVPKLTIEGELIGFNFLPIESVWKSDLDFLFAPKDRLVVLSFMTNDKNISTANNTVTASAFNGQNQSILLTQSFIEEVYVFLRDLFHVKKDFSINIEQGFGSSMSLEYINFVFALLVYQVRFSSQFWFTNKCLTFIFSIFLFTNSVTSLIGFTGVSLLYKIQRVGIKSLPFLSDNQFILNYSTTLFLLLTCLVLILCSSLCLAFFAHGRYNYYVSGRPVLNLKTHLTALVTLTATVCTMAPLINDLRVAYVGSLDVSFLTTLSCFGFCLIVWLLVWIVLHSTGDWKFRVVTQIGKQVIRSPVDMRRVFDLELGENSSESHELLVYNNGIAYPIKERLYKNRIMTVVENCGEIFKPLELTPDTEIYWPRASQTPDKSPESPQIKCWGNSKKQGRPRYNVKFQEPLRESIRASPVEDEGDYATLRVPEGILKNSRSLDTVSEDKVLESLLESCYKGSTSYIPASSPEPPSMSRDSPPTPPKCLSSPSGLGSNSGGDTTSSTSSGVHSSATGGTRVPSMVSLEEIKDKTKNMAGSSTGNSKPQVVSMKHKILNRQTDAKHAAESTTCATSEVQTVLVNTRNPYAIYDKLKKLDVCEPPNLGIPVIVENSNDSVVIRPRDPDYSISGRSTNMKMLTFAENENKNSQTLPHFPTQKSVGAYPGCSTMPLPVQQHPPQTGSAGNLAGNSYQPIRHTTLPIHYSGVRIQVQGSTQRGPLPKFRYP